MTVSRYPTSIFPRARELREAGWSVREIARFLANEFDLERVPTHTTIMSWTDPKWAERQRAQRRGHYQPVKALHDGRLGLPRHRREFQERRVRALADLGVPYLSIARVMAFDYPDSPWNDDRVSKLLGPSRQRNAARRAAA